MIREDATQNNRSFLEVQLLRIISPMNLTGVNGAYIYANRNRNKNNGNQTHYTRLFLLRVHSNDEGNKLLYLMETRNQNRDLWKMNVEHRDNGMLTIGTIFRILAPRPVESFMVGDIPLVVSKFPCILMETPSKFKEVKVDNQVEGNGAFAFVSKEMTLELSGLTPVTTSCSGLFCDRQRIDDWNGTDRGCGCYAMHHRRSSIAFQFDVCLHNPFTGQSLTMSNFSSNAFTSLFLTESISPSILLQQLQFTDAFFKMEDTVNSIVNLVNRNGGFTVIGWYKRGVINDKSLVSKSAGSNTFNSNNANETVQVDNGEVTFHITQIVPDDSSFYDHNSRSGKALANLQFDVSTIA